VPEQELRWAFADSRQGREQVIAPPFTGEPRDLEAEFAEL
jgi:hypothetical protein